MPTRYFKLSQDVSPGCWNLGNPADKQGHEVEDPWSFRDGNRIADPGHLRIPVNHVGRALDFTLAGFNIPVVHARVAEIFSKIAPADVQILPVEVHGKSDPFCILVATKLIRCIDDAACTEVEIWTPEDGRPEKVGQYRDVYGMRIETAKVGDAKVFRTWGWSVALIVCEEIKGALERIKTTGAKFKEV
jgi:hypothetical protein